MELNAHEPCSSFANEKGIISVATRISAAASDTRKRFCAPCRDREVRTAMMTRMFPTIVMIIMEVMAMAKAAVACGVYGGILPLWLDGGLTETLRFLLGRPVSSQG